MESFIKTVIPYLKDSKLMLILGLLIGIAALAQSFFSVNYMPAVGIALVLIFGPIVIRDEIRERTRRKLGLPDYSDTMRRGQEALDRAKANIHGIRKCPNNCGTQLWVDKGTTTNGLWRYRCDKCRAYFNFSAPQ